MSDDLVIRLRDACRGGDGCRCTLSEAAARIEALERELAEANADAERLADLCAMVHGSFGGGLVITFSDDDIAAYEQALAAHRARTEGEA